MENLFWKFDIFILMVQKFQIKPKNWYFRHQGHFSNIRKLFFHIIHKIYKRLQNNCTWKINFRAKFEKWFFFKFLKIFQFWPKIYFSSPFCLQAFVNFMNYMQKQFSDVLKMPLVPEIPIFGLNLKLLNHENKNIKFSKKIFQSLFKWRKRLQKLIFLHKYRTYELKALKLAYKHLIWTKTHANRGNWFWAKYGDF